VSEGMWIQSPDNALPVEPGWLHARCGGEAGIGPDLYAARARTRERLHWKARGDYFAALHPYMREVDVFNRAGEYWSTHLEDLRRATPTDGGLDPRERAEGVKALLPGPVPVPCLEVVVDGFPRGQNRGAARARYSLRGRGTPTR
jgi:hypothetical protein